MVVKIGGRNLIWSFRNSKSRNNGTKTVETSSVHKHKSIQVFLQIKKMRESEEYGYPSQEQVVRQQPEQRKPKINPYAQKVILG